MNNEGRNKEFEPEKVIESKGELEAVSHKPLKVIIITPYLAFITGTTKKSKRLIFYMIFKCPIARF